MRRPVLILCAVVAVGAVWVGVRLLTVRTDLAFTLGVPNSAPAAELKRGAVACQRPITVPDGTAAFDAVDLSLGTFSARGPAVEVTVARTAGGPPIARGRLAAGYPDVAQAPTHVVDVGRVNAREPLSVCVRNLGPNRVAVYGSGALAARTSEAVVNGVPQPVDLSFRFLRDEPRSLASLLPAMSARAARFRAGWVGPWTYGLGLLIVIALVPALLAAALRATGDE